MLFKPIAVALLVAPAVALIAPASFSAVPAQASVAAQVSVQASSAVPQVAAPQTKGAIQCGGDVCIQSQCAGCNIETIYAWANTSTFTGHFEFFFGIYVIRNSPNRTWPAGGTHYGFTGVSRALGSACVDAWAGPYKTGDKWRLRGQVCFYL
jgi:hypothetical protein